jgi:hypothetical protein
LGELAIAVGVDLLITDNKTAEAQALQAVRDHAALYIGGMGARGKNFYNSLAIRYGYADEARLIQDLYLDGKKAEAAAAVPAELARAMSLIGPAGYVKERVEAYRSAGVTCLLASPIADTHAERVTQMATLKDVCG